VMLKCFRCGSFLKVFVFGSPRESLVVFECPQCSHVFIRKNLSRMMDKGFRRWI